MLSKTQQIVVSNCSLKCELRDHIDKLLYSIHPLGLGCSLNRLSCAGHLENIDSLSYEVLPNVETFVIQLSKEYIC